MGGEAENGGEAEEEVGEGSAAEEEEDGEGGDAEEGGGEEAPLSVPDGWAVQLEPPPAEALTFARPASAASLALVGRHVCRRWAGDGWCYGIIRSVNNDMRYRIDGQGAWPKACKPEALHMQTLLRVIEPMAAPNSTSHPVSCTVVTFWIRYDGEDQDVPHVLLGSLYSIASEADYDSWALLKAA